MDVAREFREADYRIKLQIRRSALIAEAKIYDMTPQDYAAKLDADAAEAYQARLEAAAEATQNTMEAIGGAYRRVHDAFVDMAKGFAKGWEQAGRR